MAGFKTHITVSSCCGVGYAGAGFFFFDMPPETALVGGALCGFSGMLPDLDSDYGVPLRESMAFTAAIVPMLLVDRFRTFDLKYDQMVLLAVSLYLLVRFGATNLLRKYTVHRGMFHSIPAGFTFAGLAFLICGSVELDMRYYKAGGVLLGFMSHLLLDEIYSVEWKGGRWRFKKSIGTAFKLWGKHGWANFTTYAKLLIVGAMILGEPSVMQKLEQRNPELAQRYQKWQSRFDNTVDRIDSSLDVLPGAPAVADAIRNFGSNESGQTETVTIPPPGQAAPVPPQNVSQPTHQMQPVQPPSAYGNGYYPSGTQPAPNNNNPPKPNDFRYRPPVNYGQPPAGASPYSAPANNYGPGGTDPPSISRDYNAARHQQAPFSR